MPTFLAKWTQSWCFSRTAPSETEVRQCKRTGSLGEEEGCPWKRVGWAALVGRRHKDKQESKKEATVKSYFFLLPCNTKLSFFPVAFSILLKWNSITSLWKRKVWSIYTTLETGKILLAGLSQLHLSWHDGPHLPIQAKASNRHFHFDWQWSLSPYQLIFLLECSVNWYLIDKI